MKNRHMARWGVTFAAIAMPATALAGCGSPTDAGAEDEGGRPKQPELSVSVYKGSFATVNSYIISNGKTLTVVDLQRKEEEAKKLAEQVRSLGLPVEQVLITHGHTDHFTGMPVFREEFPDARIVVANEDVRRDIKEYAIYMDGFDALDEALRPKSDEVPNGFDYEQIEPLDTPVLELEGGGSCEIDTDYPPVEAHHMTTLYCPSINALFLSDMAFNKVHPWMGDDISLGRVATWRSELARIRSEYGDRDPAVYPGHGDPGDLSMLDEQIGYFDDYVRIVGSAANPDEAAKEITALYPDYKEADFFLHWSLLNHLG